MALGSNYEHNKVSNLENGMKLRDTEHYVNSGIGGNKVQESILAEQAKIVLFHHLIYNIVLLKIKPLTYPKTLYFCILWKS